MKSLAFRTSRYIFSNKTHTINRFVSKRSWAILELEKKGEVLTPSIDEPFVVVGPNKMNERNDKVEGYVMHFIST